MGKSHLQELIDAEVFAPEVAKQHDTFDCIGTLRVPVGTCACLQLCKITQILVDCFNEDLPNGTFFPVTVKNQGQPRTMIQREEQL